MKNVKIKNLDMLDVTKLFLTFMVVAIHANLYQYKLYPWLYVAIPLFFIISSFLLFRKINSSPENKKKEILKKYVIRLLKLYLFWFIVLLPYTIYYRQPWFDHRPIVSALTIIKSVLFSSTFPASWYLVALLEGTIIVAYFSNKKIEKFMIILYILSYIMCSIMSCYSYLFDYGVVHYFKWLSPQFTFLFSVVFIYIGKLFASDKFKSIERPTWICLSIILGILLYCEWKSVMAASGIPNSGYCILVLPFVISLFGIIINIDIKVKHSKVLRQLSNFIYPPHFTVMALSLIVIKKFVFNNNLIALAAFGATIMICSLLFLLVKKLEKYKYFKFLKNSY